MRRLALLLALAGCGHGDARASGPHEIAAARSDTSAAAAVLAPREEPRAQVRPTRAAPVAGERVAFAGGSFAVGSAPGTQFRKPDLEADGVPLELGAFEIDRLPFPNDPSEAPRTGVTRDEAARLCAENDGRLCDELEWERACGDVYPGGASYDAEQCTLDASACATRDGVEQMGITLAEWTASDGSNGPLAHGAAAIADVGLHRCASRRSLDVGLRSPNVGFRCCHGAAPHVAYPLPAPAARAFEERELGADAQRAILASLPEVARFADDFAPFSPSQALRSRNLQAIVPPDAGPRVPQGYYAARTESGLVVAQRPLVWAPSPGDVAWVMTGTSHGSTLIAVVYPMPDGSFRHAASFVVAAETAPVAVAYREDTRSELLWSSCWGCGGEGGTIVRKDDATIVVTQR